MGELYNLTATPLTKVQAKYGGAAIAPIVKPVVSGHFSNQSKPINVRKQPLGSCAPADKYDEQFTTIVNGETVTTINGNMAHGVICMGWSSVTMNSSR